ncbi:MULTISPECIES: hypothetical protein [unclassified Shewanella]|uniref:hypothetical protein n=1 Tax=Shewanella TaxID=22 RepID=UPI0021DB4FD6|nr:MULTISPECIES: hypothetical protein [unclassified Shewanella]MCU8003184.1 hypothetical protein [Shewanella sp. SM96]MCU8059437.1 hypothetical protein [Shewanella sp. SM55]MCU8075616.1 hypothetical protein [Shewanella sp. SM29]
MASRFILRLRLLTEHHYAFKPFPCLKRVKFPLNEQIFNTMDINAHTFAQLQVEYLGTFRKTYLYL